MPCFIFIKNKNFLPMLHCLHYKTKLKIDIDTAWEFFSDPKNLNIITPPDLSFEIISGAERKMYPGQIIIYKITPFPILKTYWITEITHVVPKKLFVDEQRFGPYKFWHHQHIFEETPDGTIVKDIVHYLLPFGIIGKLANRILISKRLKYIFDFRKMKLNELFNK